MIGRWELAADTSCLPTKSGDDDGDDDEADGDDDDGDDDDDDDGADGVFSSQQNLDLTFFP